MEAVSFSCRLRMSILVCVAALLVLLTGLPRANAAGPTGKILGTVLDNSGAVIAGAKVTVTNEGTGEKHTVETGGSGDFSFPVLPIGNYTLHVEKDGFQTSEQKGIILQVDQNVSIPVTLQVGTAQTVVEVSGVNVGVDLADATVSHVVDQERIVNLPLDGRDTLQLQYVMPGVSYDNDNVAHGQGQHEGVVVNGNRPGSNYYLLDGVDMTDSYLSVAPVFPAPDALQEFDIQTSNFTAQYGRSSGGIVNAATKSGTNQLHGSLFEFFRNDVLNAHNFFDGQANPVLRKPSFKLNQFGGTIGGPIQRDKTFIFGYFQESRQRKDETYTIGTVLSAQQRPDKTSDGSANFSDLCALAASNSNYVCPKDPMTGTYFPGNTIPANRIDPTALNFVKALMPLPNNGVFGYSFIAPAASTLDDDNQPQFAIRFDHTFSPKDQAFVRYFFNQDRSTGLGFDNFPGALHFKNFRNQNIAIDWTHTFSPNFLNTAVFGFTRLSHTRGPSTSIGWSAFGGPGSQNHAGVPSELYTSINGSINGGGDGTFTQNRGTWQYTDYVSLVRGRHTMAIGFDFRKEAVNRVEDYFTDPYFTFNGQYTGNALADLLTGLPNYYNLQTEVKSELRHSAVDLYIGDNFKVKPNFTVDAGLRWEPFLPPVDNLNDQVCFDPTFTKQSSYYPTAPPGILFPGPPVGSSNLGKGDPGCQRQLIPTRWKNYAPRFGFNWDPSKQGKMSVRASYGLFWDQARLIGYNRFSTSQPFDDSVIVNGVPSSGPNQFAPSLTGDLIYTNSGVTNPYPFIIPRTPAQRAAFSPSFGGNWPTSALEDFLAPNYNEGYSQEWNLTLEHQFFSDYTLTLSYIGNHGSKLWVAREFNYALPSSYDPTLSLTDNLNNLPNRRRLSGIQCGTGTASTTGPCYGPLEEEDPAGYSHFNSVQVTLNRRMSHGLTFLTSYVFGRYLDIVSYGAEGGQGPRDPQNFALSYGPSDMDVRHRFVTSYIWQIPKMDRFSGISGSVINGWSVQGIADLQTGSPFSVNSSENTAANGVGGDTADLVSGQKISISHKSIREYFNTGAFTNAAPNTYGDTGRNFLYGPSLVNFDTSFFKQIPISERLGKMEFRAELFNTFNHANFGNPDNTVGDGTFGQILSARDPRFVQFALKWLF